LIAECHQGSSVRSPSEIPEAYVADDLTVALIWLYARMDHDLLSDDGDLHESWSAIRGSLRSGSDTIEATAMTSLSPVSRMWLGSRVCAAFIEDSLRRGVNGPPTFWTREQRGEEAATWLSFTHKQLYLSRTTGPEACRTFCLPTQQVATSSSTERILLLLAIAYMEALGVRCRVVTDAAYSEVDGFVLAGSHAIRANWIRTATLWQVADHRSSRSTIPYAELIAASDRHAIVSDPTPVRRLRALAEYLELDWSWMLRRCSEIADAGLQDLIRPRSRHLSLDGTQTAISFIATLGPDHN
jgi:hypothetical protein